MTALRDHRLAALLMPKTVALVGASPKEGTVGQGIIQATTMPGTPARVSLINPRYEQIGDRPCYPSIRDVPEKPEMAVLAVANDKLEQALIDAIDAGAKAATIFASGYLEDDREPRLTRRIADRAREAGVQICGGNGMGFYNLAYGLRVCGYPPPDWMRRGGAALLTHSGSVFSALCHNDHRLAWSLSVSAGQELTTTIADYFDFVLDLPETRCVGLFLETVRDPQGFREALAKAEKRDIPVVALKVGKTAMAAAKAVSHSGAIAGNHAAYQALFDHHNVIEVDTLDDFANTLRLFSGPRRIGAGGVATMHDSGGLLELTIDLAERRGVRFAQISESTKKKLSELLDYGLEPTNPLDAWGTGRDYESNFADLMSVLVNDPDAAIGMLCVETRDGYYLSDGYGRALEVAFARTDKPVVIVSNLGSNGSDGVAQHLTENGIPALSGIDSALSVMAKIQRHIERRAKTRDDAARAPAGLRDKWLPRLRTGQALDEDESLALLADFGVPVPPRRIVTNTTELKAAIAEMGLPVVLKTAIPGIHHKSDVGGVKLNLNAEKAAIEAFEDLANRLGPRVLVMPMVRRGVELALGGLVDPQFGPLVMVSAGGTLIEILQDRAFALAPIGRVEARELLDGLKLRKLLDGQRGQPPAMIEDVVTALCNFSVLMADLADVIAEIDVNPVSAGPNACLALDGLVVPKAH